MIQDAMFQRLSVLADKSRFRILKLMANSCISTCCDRIQPDENGCCVVDVVNATNLSQPTVSHHLKALEQAGLVLREQRGPFTCYFPNPESIRQIGEWLEMELISQTTYHDGDNCCTHD